MQQGDLIEKPGNRDEALRSLLVRSKSERAKWEGLKTGATDEEILGVMEDVLPKGGRSESKYGIGHVRVKPTLAFWFGSFAVGEPTFKDDDLVNYVRDVMEIPQPGNVSTISGKSEKPDAAPVERGPGDEDLDAPAVEWAADEDPSSGAADVTGSFKETRVRAFVDFETKALWLAGPTGQVIARNIDEAKGLFPETDWEKELARGLAMKPPDAFEQQVEEFLDQKADEDGREKEALLTSNAEWDAEHPDWIMDLDGEVTTLAKAMESEQLVFVFDFAGLEDDDAQAVKKRTIEIRQRVRKIQQYTVEIGDCLRDVKRRLPFGGWANWLEAETPFSPDTANRLIGVAELAEQSPQFAATVGQFDKSAQYLLVKASTPESAREEMLARAEENQPISHAAAKGIVERHSPPSADDDWQAPLEKHFNEESASFGMFSEGPAETAEAEVVATGRTQADLLSVLRGNADGMQIEDLVKMGFSEKLVEQAHNERVIDKTVTGKCSYCWTPEEVVNVIREKGPQTLLELEFLGCKRYAVLAAKSDGLIAQKGSKWELADAPAKSHTSKSHAATQRPQPGGNTRPEPRVEDLLKGKALSLTFSWLPALPGKVTVGVCVGSDRMKTAYQTLDASKVRGFPDAVQDLIVQELAKDVKSGTAASSGSGQKAASIRKGAKKKSPRKAISKKTDKSKGVVSKGTAAAIALRNKSKPAAKKKGGTRTK